MIEDDTNRLLERVTWLKDNINKMLNDVLLQLVKEILELNKSQLYDKGVITTGVRIDSFHPYTALTISLKKQKGQKVSNVTLKDTGDFYSNFFVNFKPESFTIGSDDPKTGKLTSEDKKIGFGKQIFGLTDESIDFLRKLVYEKLMPELYAQIGQN